ncbi:glycerol kinase GlpK [Scatolibacter rhodanostii]|uniref:glycerol kinase GlpK n=1 Tax=Scatolibacter rhodanostii TaxID=2014781 RepID=UPI000C06F4A8|nr:glycerol kinase GlpK [Scatolibacter rhodanostii]
MKVGQYILSLDQGTTSSRAILFDAWGSIVGVGQKEFTQIYPQPGYVEHDAVEILESVLFAMRQAVAQSGISARDIAAIGITNQRETTVAWDAHTGLPICNAIVWQCRRTAAKCEELKKTEWVGYIKKTTGLLVDPYFSGTKMNWIMENIPTAKKLAEENRLCFGTIDTWLIYALTDRKTYVTDVSNASRTMLFDIRKLCWDDKLLNYLEIPRQALPKVVDSSGVIGYCEAAVLGEAIPIAGIAGDQHAALFGQCCFEKGMIKNTYGTGCFALMNTGTKPIDSENGLLTTIGWKIGDQVVYALEGSAFHAGSAIKWLRDELGIIQSAAECDQLAETVEDTGDVWFVPAFTGLGAPYWDMYARGALLGITRGTSKAHICRAVLESIAHESADLLRLFEEETGEKLCGFRVDGGASKSWFLMQFQADILKTKVEKPSCLETTALGAAMLAGLAVGVWENQEELSSIWQLGTEFLPDMPEERRNYRIQRWHKAVERSQNWVE